MARPRPPAVEVPWPPMDGDPYLYTQMLHTMGAAGVKVEELYTLTMDEFESIGPIFGIVFLYKWRPDELRDGLPLPDPGPVNDHPELLHDIFFANQVINAAAATQALTTIVLNIQSNALKLGADMADFKAFVKHLDPPLAGLAIHNAAFIRDAHLSVARRPPSPAADGLGPPRRGPGRWMKTCTTSSRGCPSAPRRARSPSTSSTPSTTRPCTLGRWPPPRPPKSPPPRGSPSPPTASGATCGSMPKPKIKYRALAVVDHQIMREVAALERLRARVEAEGETRPGDEEEEARLMDVLAAEDERLAGWTAESARRRHDYMPFLVETLKLLASKGELTALIDAAREQKRATAKAAAKAAKAARGGKSKTPRGGGGRDGGAGGSSHG
eukprot:TRINITY_DN2618_c0_g1_i1.p1 TRINITY_DN2618_c0_g1~~TRINITY_DN2618_c0_g1_i1.p1  ORF type:complete len:384 (-),score=129.18 TRINITY_DN2618_c0_g1_i1:786-1937(-)